MHFSNELREWNAALHEVMKRLSENFVGYQPQAMFYFQCYTGVDLVRDCFNFVSIWQEQLTLFVHPFW